MSMNQPSKRQIRKWVFSGAMHPIALIREPLAKRIREQYSEIWDDLDPYQYPWPATAPTLRDAVSATCQDEFKSAVSMKNHYWNLLDQVWMTIFGAHHVSKNLKNV